MLGVEEQDLLLSSENGREREREKVTSKGKRKKEIELLTRYFIFYNCLRILWIVYYDKLFCFRNSNLESIYIYICIYRILRD